MSTAFFFPGQGSQAPGMGKALAEQFAAARQVFERADEALGRKLSTLCFEGPAEDLARTANTQPAILAASIAALEVIRAETDLRPSVALGHSLGEFSALVCTGALAFEDAVRLVEIRGQAMQQAVPEGVGSMAAILGMEMDRLTALCEEASQGEVVAPANENGGGQIVVAGHANAVARLVELAKADKARAIPLKVSAPFHCSLMQPAADRLSEALEDIEVKSMTAPVITNVEAEPNDDPSRVKGLLVTQVTQRVRWEESVRKALHMGVKEGVEVGHGKVITGLVKRIDRSLTIKQSSSPADIDVLKVQRQ